VPRLAQFVGALPSNVEVAFEFRHPSWFTDETYAVLRERKCALCIADTDEDTTPFVSTAPFGYVRLRRMDYTPEALAAMGRTAARHRRLEASLRLREARRGGPCARARPDVARRVFLTGSRQSPTTGS
jgi:uncharacterized protein YecE (DUF72 family)